jgi:hypothetical protein
MRQEVVVHEEKIAGQLVHWLCAFLLILVFWSLTGCESYKPIIESNKDSSYAQRLTRVLVATNLDRKGLLKFTAIMPADIQKAIADKWAAFGVTVSSVDLEGVNGGTKSLADAIASFRPQQVLEIKTASVAN